MKELSIEQKAACYDKVREKIALRFGSNVAEEIFSEFEMSEDEKIMKEIAEFIYNAAFKPKDIKRKEKWLTWLEKQGETYTKREVDDAYIEGMAFAKDELEKQNKQILANSAKTCKDEQKPIIDGILTTTNYDKMFQNCTAYKFHIGDWIANDYCVGRVIALADDAYLLDTGQGIPFSYEHNAQLWTIQDAKDGDILAVEPIERYQIPFIAIYKNRGLDFFNSYCFIGFDGKFYEADEGHALDDIHPATKEQRDLLFQKMKEAGYEWDEGKKELKKIEQNPAWSEEDERLCQCLIEDQEEALDKVRNDKYGHSEIISDLKEMYHERIDWLKSLKDRVQPQTWKPSDEQMYILNWVANILMNKDGLVENNAAETLNSLYNGLKKLREE